MKPDTSAERVSAAIEGFFNEGIVLSPEILHFADSCPGCSSILSLTTIIPLTIDDLLKF